MGYKYCVCPFEDGNYAMVGISYIGDNTKPNIDIDKSRLDNVMNVINVNNGN